MELKNIYTFLRVAELSSFTKAAETLGYSQSTVTIQIKQLENELGVMLFDRIGKTISLTSNGVSFMDYANEFVRLATKVKSLGQPPEKIVGTLRLGVLESIFVWQITDLLPIFYEKFPYINIEIKSATGAVLYKMLRQNDLDIIYLLDNVIYQKDCIRACTSPVDVKFVASPENPLVKQKNISLAEIAKQPLILAERDAIYRRELDNEAAKKNIEIVPMLEVDNLEVVIRLLKKNLGISFLPDYVVNESVNRNELAVLDVKYSNLNLWSQLVYHKNKFLTPQMQAFIELIRQDPR